MQDMLREAARLTSSGRLRDATTLIQHSLRVKTAPIIPKAPPVDDNMTIEGTFQIIDTPGEYTDFTDPPPQNAPTGDKESGFFSGTYGCSSGERAYKLYVPHAYQGQPLPLLVMLHGCKQNPDDFAAGTDMNSIGEHHQCFVLYPGQSSQANSSGCWNWFRHSDQQRGYGEPAIIAGMTQEIMWRYGIDNKRVYVAGLSAGGAMALVMGTTYPDIYAAVGVHSGIPYAAATDIPSALAAMQQGLGKREKRSGRQSTTNTLPTIVFHGDSDKTVHPMNGDQVIKQAQAGFDNGTTPNPSTRQEKVPDGRHYSVTVHHNEKSEPSIEHWVIHGAGHAWSGGSTQGSYTDSLGPNASQEMVRFFLQHPAPPSGSLRD
ncbi:extracellular catalytic domain type 1 short-chain-length polyhydroxyalkanoate depolymerase [Chitinimonas sp. BJB300]|uniref:extracellular catalytic domain type 1 short-chain-length polyhydroxyalkanoate depolymerase n=1 Tax=Chitinimonas sp. BJB300 TaxID=1559339 RepID=UPI001E2D0008|nr:PHB depolymerase family esterase [Chitinimonas sp. BJB300]